MWARAVWIEGNVEEEAVVPLCWIDTSEEILYWPKLNERTALKKKQKPVKGNKWWEFKLLQIKFTSVKYDECDDYEITTTVKDKTVNEAEDAQKRNLKKRTLEDWSLKESSEDEESTSHNCQALLQSLSKATLAGPPKKKHFHLDCAPKNPRTPKMEDSDSDASSVISQQDHQSSGTVGSRSPRRTLRHSKPSHPPSTSSLPHSSKESWPMLEARFQEKVLMLLTEIRDTVRHRGRRAAQEEEINIVQIRSLADFIVLEQKVTEDPSASAKLKSQMLIVGGVTLKENTKRILTRLLTNEVMSGMNFQGKRGKFGFGLTTTYQILQECVLTNHEGTLSDVQSAVTSCLKYAPDRFGGSGRKLLREEPSWGLI
ncbi:uncharacterized protein si:dkey-65l23.2 isoform X2 [Syngnathoides biaculeatus]|nr:uncharacterized protein si:dkey-65l23.2 isoform X2 [Syngnathoides biaculeatus]XP_061694376.1 uncharacterized protein si:dkey-65l23.2 isoform X2 [Syngnathoides biaculeatus]